MFLLLHEFSIKVVSMSHNNTTFLTTIVIITVQLISQKWILIVCRKINATTGSSCNLVFNSYTCYLQGKNEVAKEHLSFSNVNVVYDERNKIKHERE